MRRIRIWFNALASLNCQTNLVSEACFVSNNAKHDLAAQRAVSADVVLWLTPVPLAISLGQTQEVCQRGGPYGLDEPRTVREDAVMVDIKPQDADTGRHVSRGSNEGYQASSEPQEILRGKFGRDGLGPVATLTQALFDAFQRSPATQGRRSKVTDSAPSAATSLTLPKPR